MSDSEMQGMMQGIGRRVLACIFARRKAKIMTKPVY